MQLKTAIAMAATFAAGMCSAATYMWTGGAGDGKFSSPANWGVESAAFTAEDTCVFLNTTALDVTVDEPVTVGTITFSGSGALTIGGEATLTVTKMTNVYSQQPVFNCPVAFAGTYRVDFATDSVNFAGGVSATGPDDSIPDNAASHALKGEFHFTADWVQYAKLAYPFTVPSGSKLYGKLLTGGNTDVTEGTNPGGVALVVEEGGYAEFDRVVSASNYVRVSVRGRLKVNGVYEVGVDGNGDNSHVGFDGDESFGGVIEAAGVLKYSHANCYVKVPTLYIGAQGLGAVNADFTLHMDGCDKTIYATDDFEIKGPVNNSNLNDWGLTLDKAVVFDTQGHTVTWTGAVMGDGSFSKAGDGTLVMKPHGCGVTSPVAVNGGRLVIANRVGVGSCPITLAAGTTLELDDEDKTMLAGAVSASAGSTIIFHIQSGVLKGRLASLALPESGTVKLQIVGEEAGVTGSNYMLTSGAQLADGAAASFELEGRDDMALSIVGGELVATVTSSDVVVKTFTYAATSAADAVWSLSVPAWTTPGVSGNVPFETSGNAVFTDPIPAEAQTVMVTDSLLAGDVTITNSTGLTLAGNGVIGGMGTVTKAGAGTLTLNGANFGDKAFVLAEGKLVLGPNAGVNSLGADSGAVGGKVTILDGAQFNLNSTNTAGTASDPRHEITQLKTFVVEGSGPDGRGAIVNDALDGRTEHTAGWGAAFRRIELAGDTTIGGTDRFDVRVRNDTGASAQPGIYGHGKNLTITCTGWFCLIGQPIDVQSVLVTNGGVFRPENMQESFVNIPDGITLDDGTLQGFGSTYPAAMPIHVGARGATFYSADGDTTIKGPIDLADGAALKFDAGNGSMVYSGGITQGSGSITAVNGHHRLAGPFSGSEIMQTGGNLYLAENFSADTLSLVQTGGSFGFMPRAGAAPSFRELNFSAGGGYFDIRPQAPDEIIDIAGVVNFDQPTGTTIVYGPANDHEYGIALKLVGSTPQLSLGYTVNNAGTLRLKEGSHLTVKNLHLGTNGSEGNGPASGRLIIDAGATVIVTNELHMGRWSQNPAVVSTHVIDVGGVLDASRILYAAAWDGPREETYLRQGGLLKAAGILANHRAADNYGDGYSWGYGSGAAPADGRHWFLMEGGRLELGTHGIRGQSVPGVTRIDFQNGDVAIVDAELRNADGDVIVEDFRCDPAFPVVFGHDRKGGSLTFDMGEHPIDWNTGLSGASDVTIKGSADFRSVHGDEHLQGALIGKLTVENTGANDLTMASSFGGGLTLASGVRATVAKYADERYPFAMAGNVLDQMADSVNASCAFVAGAAWQLIHRHYAEDQKRRNNLSFLMRGEFYVPAEKAGVWTFSGNYDDHIRLDVDGAQVFKTSGWDNAQYGSVELSTGWHKFSIATYDGTGGCGPAMASWGDGKAMGFIVGASTSTTSGDYTKFEPGANLGDGLALQVRPVANVCVWSWQNGNADWDTTEKWAHIKCLDSIAPMHKNSNLADAGDWSGYFSGKSSKFEGWFKVEKGQAGEWTFNMGYDDRKLLAIDGEELIRHETWDTVASAKKTLNPGWHRWEVRVQDGTGGWGPTVANNGNTLSYLAPGEAEEKQFNETNLTLAATLGDIAVIEPAGIYGELALGEGSLLLSDGTMAMPIFGTLKGTGMLQGQFAFAGDDNCWEVEGVDSVRELNRAQFADASAETFRGLRAVKATFNDKPKCLSYYLSGEVSGLSPDDVAGAVVTVTDGENDYSEKFSLSVANRRLVLKNIAPAGTIMFVR